MQGPHDLCSETLNSDRPLEGTAGLSTNEALARHLCMVLQLLDFRRLTKNTTWGPIDLYFVVAGLC